VSWVSSSYNAEMDADLGRSPRLKIIRADSGLRSQPDPQLQSKSQALVAHALVLALGRQNQENGSSRPAWAT
jgi:hypothetical protein